MNVIVLAGALSACSVEDQSAPTFAGPSEFALSVTLTATPDQLLRDGNSQSVITVTVRDVTGRPVSGQRLAVTSNVGTVTQTEVVTGDDGRATFGFVAPSSGSGSNTAVVRAVPVGENSQNQVGRTVTIALTGIPGVTSTTAPTARFTFSPSAPVLRQTVTFDASETLDEYTDQTPLREDDDDPRFRCNDACTYSWDFGGEATRTGRIVTYQFQAVRTYAVTLTVTDPAASTGTKAKNVEVTQGTLPTAAFTFSPSSPGQFETVNFTAAASTVGVGRTVSSYQWRFGDGSTATGITTSHAYNVVGTYNVQLTVTDSAGLQHSTTQAVTVVNGVSADFTISPSPAPVGRSVVFDAEQSKGSSNGFGGRNPIVKYIWQFGEQSTTIEETTSRVILHTFSVTGIHTINLTVEDSAGRRNQISRTLTVN